MRSALVRMTAVLPLLFSLCGCVVAVQKGGRTDEQNMLELSSRADELNRARKSLEERLSRELSDKTVKLDVAEKGLVITFAADILFDSGKSRLKPEAFEAMDKISRVLLEDAPDLRVGIEGHTDNEPIQASGWKSNWELSVARALSVLHYLQDEKAVDGGRLSAIGYGEQQPVADNSDKKGRQLNRRVEIVIMPRSARAKGISAPGVKVPENLK